MWQTISGLLIETYVKKDNLLKHQRFKEDVIDIAKQTNK